MTVLEASGLRTLQGRRVCLSLRGGQRMDDCHLMSTDHGGFMWVFVNGTDTFVALSEILDLWEG